MTELNNVEEAVRVLEEGTHEEQKEALSVLEEHSHTQPEVLVPYLDGICSFASDGDIMVRRDVATILSNVATHEPNAVMPHTNVVCALITDNDPHVISFAMMAAAMIARESPMALSDMTDRLIELLTYENIAASYAASITRSRAVAALGYLGKADRAIATRIDESLAGLLADTEVTVRIATVTTLTRLGLAHPNAVPTALAELSTRLDDPEPDVRRKAIRAYTLFRHDQPAAISQPSDVAPAFKQAAERAGPELDETEKKGFVETYRYIKDVLMAEGNSMMAEETIF